MKEERMGRSDHCMLPVTLSSILTPHTLTAAAVSISISVIAR